MEKCAETYMNMSTCLSASSSRTWQPAFICNLKILSMLLYGTIHIAVINGYTYSSPLPYAGAKKLKSDFDDFADAPTVRDAVDKLASGETWIDKAGETFMCPCTQLSQATVTSPILGIISGFRDGNFFEPS